MAQMGAGNMKQTDQLLFEAARRGDEEAIATSLLAGADIDAIELGLDQSDPEAWRTPLSMAAFHGQAGAFERLLRAGADAFAHEHIALAHACAGSAGELAEKLLRMGSDPDARGGEPLSAAMESGDSKLVRCLIAFGANTAKARWAGDSSPEALAAFEDRRLRGLSARRRAERAQRRNAPLEPEPLGRPGSTEGGHGKRRRDERAYWAARLRAANPETWDAWRAGRFACLTDALVEAGLKARRVGATPTVEGFERSIRNNLQKSEIKALAARLLATNTTTT